MLRRLLDFFTSLKLTAVLLGLATLLVFVGTIAQVEQGLYQAQARYFKSLFVFWSPGGSALRIPVFPGGYLIGGLMLLNLLAATVRRLHFTRQNFGLLLVHLGLVLLFLGQLFTDVLSVESAMRLRVGETLNYSEDFHVNELALMDRSDAASDTVISIPERMIAQGGDVTVPGAPFTLGVRRYWANADILNRSVPVAEPSGATAGAGQGLFVIGKPVTTKLDERNTPAALLEVRAGGTNQGLWLVASGLTQPQPVRVAGKVWDMALRPKRHYEPFSLTLVDCQHDVYPGTEIPKNFSSRVRVTNPQTQENREVLIYMNNPLRYGGNTYYQYQMDARSAEKASTLQVVRNPSWLTPYLSCTLIGLGLAWQFLAHLIGFLNSRRHEK